MKTGEIQGWPEILLFLETYFVLDTGLNQNENTLLFLKAQPLFFSVRREAL